jgi:hypothetical protein
MMGRYLEHYYSRFVTKELQQKYELWQHHRINQMQQRAALASQAKIMLFEKLMTKK